MLQYADQIKGYVADTTLILNNALDEDKVVLFEGGQGTLLDVDHGTYPSSPPRTRPRAAPAPVRVSARRRSAASSAS